ncbi:iron-containing alcohol dehydrogenase [Thermodesulfovibrionales bacterium]|nr:iron-containing alcohol dehydrogenase [Thermodesulfovibrionales bacterium]
MLDFNLVMPTRIFFGKNKIEFLGEEVKRYSDKILLTYGRESIKKNGIYGKVIKALKDNDISFIELPGIPPNPTIHYAKRGIELCRRNNLQFILAVGGGSVIDCSKAIALGAKYDGDVWDFYLGKGTIKDALPIGTVLTIVASGSETNEGSVLTNEHTELKLLVLNDILRPRFAIMDPTYTFTVPRKLIAAGVADIFSHILEIYFCPEKNTYLQDRLLEGLFKTCIKYGIIAINELNNYEARANLMWTSSLALNGFVLSGKIGDWGTHMIGHEISAMHGVTHGIGVAILTPHWMEYTLDENTLAKYADFAVKVWGVQGTNKMEIAKEGISRTKDFLESLELPTSLREVGIKENELGKIAKNVVIFGDVGEIVKLNEIDVLNILRKAY